MDLGQSPYGLVLVTAGTEAEAKAIAHALVTEKLAACVNCFPVQSTYTWQGEVHQDAEWQLLIKTNLRRFGELETRIRDLHSYDVPEIIALPIQSGSAPYLAWLAEQTI